MPLLVRWLNLIYIFVLSVKLPTFADGKGCHTERAEIIPSNLIRVMPS